ncbi:hypothetical protein [Actinokineospora cianjurensis]|uniref:hypothetical protein n=1 Tax=Actinokineospora cianjurensis TaxID=585224 RepID=UPI000EB54136|nr:hypothetical protein [Actinokineospora cianjurensis]
MDQGLPASSSAGATTEVVPATSEAAVGVAVPFQLPTHCGIKYARFADKWWRAEQESPDPRRVLAADGSGSYTGSVPGRVVLVDERTLRFTVDSGVIEGGPTEVVLHPTADQPPLCD